MRNSATANRFALLKRPRLNSAKLETTGSLETGLRVFLRSPNSCFHSMPRCNSTLHIRSLPQTDSLSSVFRKALVLNTNSITVIGPVLAGPVTRKLFTFGENNLQLTRNLSSKNGGPFTKEDADLILNATNYAVGFRFFQVNFTVVFRVML